MVLGATLRLVIIGVVIGIPMAVAATNLIAQRLYGLSPFDPLTIAVAVAIMLVTSIAAGIGPASRAARVDPLEALRRE